MTIDVAKLPSLSSVKAELCRRSLFYFVKEFWGEVIPEDPVWNWHIEYLCNELQSAVQLVIDRKPKEKDIIINIPPGSSKSTIASVMLPAWVWTVDQTIRTLSASYSASLSTDLALKSRDIIKSDKYRLYFPEVRIKQDQDNKTYYKNEKGGDRYATSVGGTITGFHAHLKIVDDPINPKKASSEVERSAVNNWMGSTLSSRSVDKAVSLTVLIMQRLHADDPTGNWLAKKASKIHHICLPAELSNEVKPFHLKDKYIDGLLDPIRINEDNIAEARIELGSYGYAGQFSQSPAPPEGGIWKKWIIGIPDDQFPPELSQVGTDWDLAYTEKESNSACAYVTAGKIDKNMYIDDLGFKWLEFPELVKYMELRQRPHYIEAKASGKSAKQTLVKMGIPAIEVTVSGGDKVARANMATPYGEAGMIYCRQSLLDKLYHDEKQGILRFPNGSHDDLQDALVQAINRLLLQKRVISFF